MGSLSAPTPLFLRDMVRDVSARLSVAKMTGQLDGFVESMKELDTAWWCRRDEVQPGDLVDMKAEMSSLFEQLRSLIEENASRHADVAIRPRLHHAVPRTVPSWQANR